MTTYSAWEPTTSAEKLEQIHLLLQETTVYGNGNIKIDQRFVHTIKLHQVAKADIMRAIWEAECYSARDSFLLRQYVDPNYDVAYDIAKDFIQEVRSIYMRAPTIVDPLYGDDVVFTKTQADICFIADALNERHYPTIESKAARDTAFTIIEVCLENKNVIGARKVAENLLNSMADYEC